MPDYNLGKIYKIVDNTNGNLYVGSTCEPSLARRLAKHVGNYRNWKEGKQYKAYMTSYKILENDNYDIVLIESCPCESKDQLHARERHYIEELQCVNKHKPGMNYEENKDLIVKYNKEYRIKHLEKIKDYEKLKYEKNKESIKQRVSEYRENNKEKIKLNKSEKFTCICGVEICKYSKFHHEKTKKHNDFINSQTIEM